MAEGVEGDALGEFGPAYRLVNRILGMSLVQMVALQYFGPRNLRKGLLRKDALPNKILSGRGILRFQSVIEKYSGTELWRQKIKTYNIQHEVGIKASPEAVYRALTDTKKLAEWWTSDTRGNGSKVGGVLEFWFGDYCHQFEVVELQPGKLVRWKANRKEGIEEWAGTEVAFSLSADKKQCYVHFSHSGWLRDSGIFPHSSTKWAVFLLSLKDLLEKGKGHPAPNDLEINYD